MHKGSKKALLMIDLQNDFCEGGSLAVPFANEIIPLANQLQPHFDWVAATQDWHPPGHFSFASSHPAHPAGSSISNHNIWQILWPDHCVQGTRGAAFHQDLVLEHINLIVHKGTDKKVDSYSAFFDNSRLHQTGLAEQLRLNDIQTLYIMGLATDYCVKYSVLDALSLGFQVHVLIDACRGIDHHPGDIVRSFETMQREGAHLMTSADVFQTGE